MAVRIKPKWNVNLIFPVCLAKQVAVRIKPKWNVNPCSHSITTSIPCSVRIKPKWNVNIGLISFLVRLQ